MKKYIFITLLVVGAGLFAYHFIAADQAEQEIDRAIQAETDSSATPFSVKYSAIDVSPFSGNIDFADVTIIQQRNIERADNVQVDLEYFDFLRIYFNGIEEGLRQLAKAAILLDNVSHINRETMQELSVSQAEVRYRGNILDGLRRLMFDEPLTHSHHIDLAGAGIRYTKPNSLFGTFSSDSAALQFHFPKHTSDSTGTGTGGDILMKNITWDPPARFQKKYGFFIQGFGYKLNAIPVESVMGSMTRLSPNRVQIRSGIIETDLCTIRFEGIVRAAPTWDRARLDPLQITVVDLSQEFQNVLANMEQLLGVSLPKQQNQITFQLSGPITNPRISRNN